MLRAGTIGWTGRGGFGHGMDVAFAGIPGVEVVAVADPDETGRVLAAMRSGAQRHYSSYHEMLEREHLNLISIGMRFADCHEEPLMAAAEHGAHVYCEKPLTDSLQSVDRMVEACRKHGVRAAVAHQNRIWPAPQKARELVQSGAIGQLRSIRAYTKLDHRSGGEDLMILGTHLLDLMRFFAGDAEWVFGRVTESGRDVTAGDIRPGREGIGPVAGDAVTAQFGFRGGVIGVYQSFRAEPGGSTDYFRVELWGTAGILSFPSGPRQELFHANTPVILPGRTPWQEVTLEPMQTQGLPEEEEMHPANQALVRDLISAASNDREPLSSIVDARAALEMIMGIYHSHFSGGRISLPLLDRRHPLRSDG